MEKIIIINEKIKNNTTLIEEDLNYLKEQKVIKNSKNTTDLIEAVKNANTINLISNHPRKDILLELLKENNIDILESSKLSISLNSLGSEIECKDEEIIIIDGLEIFLENSQGITSLDSSISKVREKLPCKNALPISLALMSGVNDEWEEKFDNLGSDNPERDMLEYSNKRELLNHISLEIKRKKESNYKQLQNNLDLIIQQNSSNEDIERIRAKYQKENNSKKIYQKKQQLLIEIAKDLNLNLKNEPIQEKMKELIHRLESQEFSIGVTGIMKAGKSTMMNALLQREILGTAIRPETANLSIIKKGQDKAKVYFWSEDEWRKIKELALDEQSKEFVLVSEKLNGFSKYIGLEEKEIAIEELDYYTSARKSEGLCNLVKEVELKLPLEFLDMGVSLVDTPGIDDPIVQREIITKEYLGSCSAILHLMNAKQSATQKDIEFIGDALLDQGVSSLLVVITRIDTLGNSKEEIEQKLINIITHAKRNIETYLNKRANSDISTILAKVEFLPLAGKFAMQHRIGDSQKALKKGYELKDTGILEIENYLNSMLFGDRNKRAKLAISNAHRSIENDVSAYLNQLNEQYSLIGLERNEIDKRLSIVKQEREEISLQLNEVLLEIDREERNIKEELERLRNLFESRFRVSHQTIVEKISNYIEEELYNNRKPVREEIKEIIEVELKIFISKLTQEYQRKANFLVEESLDYINGQYHNTLEHNIEINKAFNSSFNIDKLDMLGDIEDMLMRLAIGGVIGGIVGFALGPVGIVGAMLMGNSLENMYNDKRRSEIKKAIESKIKEVSKELKKSTDNLQNNIDIGLKKFDEALICSYKTIASEPSKRLKDILFNKEKDLNELSQNLTSKEKSDSELKEILSNQIEIIEKNLNKLSKV